MRSSVLVSLAVVVLGLALGASAAAQETEAPSSRPAPSPGNPAPPLAAPREGTLVAGAPDRSAAQAAVRAQCVADRAKFCGASSGVAALACLSGNFARLTPDCQSAVAALKQAQTERAGMPR